MTKQQSSRSGDERAETPTFDWQDYWAMVLAAFEVLWKPVLLMSGGFVLFYLLAWLWLHL